MDDEDRDPRNDFKKNIGSLVRAYPGQLQEKEHRQKALSWFDWCCDIEKKLNEKWELPRLSRYNCYRMAISLALRTDSEEMYEFFRTFSQNHPENEVRKHLIKFQRALQAIQDLKAYDDPTFDLAKHRINGQNFYLWLRDVQGHLDSVNAAIEKSKEYSARTAKNQISLSADNHFNITKEYKTALRGRILPDVFGEFYPSQVGIVKPGRIKLGAHTGSPRQFAGAGYDFIHAAMIHLTGSSEVTFRTIQGNYDAMEKDK